MLHSFAFYLFMLASSMMAIGASSWFSCWVAMELGVIGFLPLISHKEKGGAVKSSVWKYFIVQAISSMVFLFGVSIFFSGANSEGWVEPGFTLFSESLLSASMAIKLGAFPFHGWVLEVIENLSWLKLFFIFSVQKILPILVLMNTVTYETNKFLYLFGASSLLGSFLCMYEESTRKLMVYSSMLSTGWVMVALSWAPVESFIFFLCYSWTLGLTFFFFEKAGIFCQSNFFILANSSWANKIYFMLFSGGLLGVPPFATFFPKFLILKTLFSAGDNFWAFVLLLSSSIMVFLYLPIFSQNSFLSSNFLPVSKKVCLFSPVWANNLAYLGLLLLTHTPLCVLFFTPL